MTRVSPVSRRMVMAANGLPRTPAPGEIFTPEFLPPLADRPLKLV